MVRFHHLDLAVRLGKVRFGEPVLYAIGLADHVEAHLTRPGGVPVAGLLVELDAIVGQDSVDVVRHGFQQVLEELPGWVPFSRVDHLGDCELARAVYADEQVELAFGSMHLGNIDVEEANRLSLEALSLRLVLLDVWRAGDAVPLQATM